MEAVLVEQLVVATDLFDGLGHSDLLCLLGVPSTWSGLKINLSCGVVAARAICSRQPKLLFILVAGVHDVAATVAIRSSLSCRLHVELHVGDAKAKGRRVGKAGVGYGGQGGVQVRGMGGRGI